ncbi:MAG: toll/interleukin-1 receptor domain-containing protein, partial [Xanthobacteraceae bacterium]
MSGKIFINYRRGDDPGNTGRLFDRLQDVFPPQQLFLDVDNIAPGLDFVGVLNERVGECDILLAVIGRTWVEARDAAGNRRLEDPDDFVRIEIESALNQDKRVIPVLVGDAPMPRPEDLPTALRPLARRNAVRLTHERFRADTQGLIKALQQALTEIEAQHEVEARAEAERRAEEERRLREADTTTRAAEERRVAVAEAAKRAEDETRTKLAETQARERAAEAEARKEQLEAEARERAAEERRRLEAAAKHHADEERSFAAALRVNTLAVLDAFVIAYPEGAHAAEAKVVKAALLVRDEAYRRAMT